MVLKTFSFRVKVIVFHCHNFYQRASMWFCLHVCLHKNKVMTWVFWWFFYKLLTDTGYSVCWNNVKKLGVTQHHIRQDDKMMLWALTFAAKYRYFRHLEVVIDTCSTMYCIIIICVNLLVNTLVPNYAVHNFFYNCMYKFC